MVRLYQGVLVLIPPKALPLFPGSASEGVENFGEAVRSTVVHIGYGRPGSIPIAVLIELDD